jgi:nitrate/nitrite transport system substrate-binding protein
MSEQFDDKILTRRGFLKAGATLGGMAAMGTMLPAGGVWAAGSDKPELEEVKIGFIPLTDCASVVMAAVMKFDEKYGIKIIPTKEASWASVRDKLVNGELDAAHVLYGLVYGVQLGIGGPKKDMSVLMSLNNNGQAITLSNQLKDKGATDGASLAKLVAKKEKEYTFAQTFPTGTHAMWLYYWLAAQGINPFKDVKTITVPPPQMVANMRVGNMDGFCVGEPWNNRAIMDNIGFTATTTQDIWTDHPEKVLGTTAEWAKNPNTARAMVAPFSMPASGSTPRSPTSRRRPKRGQKAYVNTDTDVIVARMLGRYENGLGKSWDDKNHMKFFNDGAVNFPYLSRRHVVHDPAQALGLAQERPGLPGRGQAGESHRHLQAGATAAPVCARAEERHAQPQADRRRGLGRQGSEEVRRSFQGQGLIRCNSGKESFPHEPGMTLARLGEP